MKKAVGHFRAFLFFWPVFLLLLALLPSRSYAESVVLSPQNLAVDGGAVTCEKYNIDGRNYFKLRDLAYVLNGTGSQFSVDFNDGVVSISTGAAYTPNGTELSLRGDLSSSAVVSSQSLVLNGNMVTGLSVYNIGGNNFLQLRELGSLLNFAVDYDSGTNTAIVKSYNSRSGADLQPLSSVQISERCSSAVFYMEGFSVNGTIRQTGSGFFISSDGFAVTNRHVVEGCYDLRIVLTDGTVYEASAIQVRDTDFTHDLALLKVSGSGFNYLPLASAENVKQGEHVYAIGSPQGLDNTMSQGIISNPKRTVKDVDFIQIQVPITHGSSGGALINEYGQAIGITSGGFGESELNLAIPAQLVRNLDRSSTSDYYCTDWTTYEGYDYLIDFGNYTGVYLWYIEPTDTGYYLEYDLSDFYDLYGLSAQDRREEALRFYLSDLERIGLEDTTASYEFEGERYIFENDTERIELMMDYEDEAILVWADFL